MATRNYEEYRAQALAKLGEDYTVEDLRNEEKFRKKVLDGLGAEYTDEDTHNFERYRLKVLENLSGGGGETWNTAFEGNVTTAQSLSKPYAGAVIVLSNSLTADSAKVILNGTEYILPKTDRGYGAVSQSGPDFTEYPCFILEMEGEYMLLTPTAGTYTLKIEEPQSGGESDFSTAEVTINKGELGAQVNCIMPWLSEEDNETSAFLALDELTESWTVKVPVGGSFITVYFSRAPQSISGDIEAGSDTTIMSQTLKSYIITGDCSISFS